jgi:aryl-alcohol dehydrogenase-like predicted oxidoreductase
MLGKHPWNVPSPGTRSTARLRENAAAAEVDLSGEEIARLDEALDALPAPMVFGGSAQRR